MLIILDELTNPVVIDTDTPEDETHWTCGECWPDDAKAEKALCGEDLTDSVLDYGFETSTCALCENIDFCFVCGHDFRG